VREVSLKISGTYT